jgi:hypothetical protein
LIASSRPKIKGLDVTPSVARHIAQDLLGRTFKSDAYSDALATPGRPASNKIDLKITDEAMPGDDKHPRKAPGTPKKDGVNPRNLPRDLQNRDAKA